jgi:hypothetical protein
MKTNIEPGSMPYETAEERQAVFNAAFDYVIMKRDLHCKTRVELFKRFWVYNLPFMEDDLIELTDLQIDSYLKTHKSIADAVYSAANWVSDQYYL